MKKVRYAMFGGSEDAFIGKVHRIGAGFNPNMELVAGCFSRNETKNKQTAEFVNLDPKRMYSTYQEMIEQEEDRKDKADFVSVVTPNNTHYEASKAFLEAGYHVLCEKPLTFTVEEAQKLKKIADQKGLLFAVAYAYQGYAMIPLMKDMIKRGDIGKILTIDSRYIQGWLLEDVIHPKSDQKPWRMRPEYTGISNSVGDIGSHIEYMVRYLTDLDIERVSAIMDTFGQPLDVNTMMHVEYENKVKGRYWVSQIAWGKLNDFNIQIFGSEGSLEWNQEIPDVVYYTKRKEATQKLVRGQDFIAEGLRDQSRVPAGHPEGYHIAFSNIYQNFYNAIVDHRNGVNDALKVNDVPSVEDGLKGVSFITAAVKSAKNDGKWEKITK
ncbi:MAG: Gfo/Idh/MocA family oxidoreductase [Acholeplasmataceae bacterium]